MGLVLKNIHSVIKCKQSRWLKPFIDLNSELRANAKNDFEKDLYKLMNNAIFGKTMENVEKHMEYELVVSKKRAVKILSSPYYKDHNIYNENMVGFYKNKKIIKLNKPQYIGFTILEFSKLIMVDFHYNYIINKYGNNAKLLYSDTDSLIYHIKTKDIYEEMYEDNDKFDFSSYPKSHPNFTRNIIGYTDDNTPIIHNAKVPAKFKEDFDFKIAIEMSVCKPKSYAVQFYDKYENEHGLDQNIEKKKGKGVPKSIVKNELHYDDFKHCLNTGDVKYNDFHAIRSINHKLHTYHCNKISINSYDNKRYILNDGITSLAHGHYKIKQH